jgi:hypothetical protein
MPTRPYRGPCPCVGLGDAIGDALRNRVETEQPTGKGRSRHRWRLCLVVLLDEALLHRRVLAEAAACWTDHGRNCRHTCARRRCHHADAHIQVAGVGVLGCSGLRDTKAVDL